jgi:uncharacterized membrane protein
VVVVAVVAEVVSAVTTTVEAKDSMANTDEAQIVVAVAGTAVVVEAVDVAVDVAVEHTASTMVGTNVNMTTPTAP